MSVIIHRLEVSNHMLAPNLSEQDAAKASQAMFELVVFLGKYRHEIDCAVSAIGATVYIEFYEEIDDED